MSEQIKPCMNTECRLFDIDEKKHCDEYRENNMVNCPKYTPTAPIIFTPKNPDDYVPGCRALCYMTSTVSETGCALGWETTQGFQQIEHTQLCNMCPNYDPTPKPKTRKFAVIRVPIIDQGSESDENIKTYLVSKLSRAMNATEEEYRNITCEIIKEEDSP